MGDNIYQRPAVQRLCRHAQRQGRAVYLETPWPQFYWDVRGLKFAYPIERSLRTQHKNIESLPADTWSEPSTPSDVYHLSCSKPGSMADAFDKCIPLGDDGASPDPWFGMPVNPAWDREIENLEFINRPFAVVRPITIRREWRVPNRNPDPAALQAVVDLLHQRGVETVGVADIDLRMETEVEPHLAGIDHKFYDGQLSVTAIAALVKRSVCAVGGVGFILPMSLALGSKLFLIFGGEGKSEWLDRTTDPRMDLSRLGWVRPEPFCMCSRQRNDVNHRCNKSIDPQTIRDRFEKWMDHCSDTMTP